MKASVDGGIFRSRSTMVVKRFTGGRVSTAPRTAPGTTASMRASRRMVISGAWAARQKVFISSPKRIGSGSTRWKHWPSRPFLWAMWSMASATKSTGTTFRRPPSTPSVGTHCGSVWRIFLIRPNR